MAKRYSRDQYAQMIERVRGSQAQHFWQLIDDAGIDVWNDLRFGDFRGVSFSHNMPYNYDLTGAQLDGCDFQRADFVFQEDTWGAEAFVRFDKAILGRVIHEPDRDPRLPAVTSQMANIPVYPGTHEIDDENWNELKNAWTRPEQWPDDAHLPIGAIFQDAPFAPEMAVVPLGTYKQGDETQPVDGIKRREVTIDYRFAVGRFPVTFEEWDFAVATGGVEHEPNDQGWGRGRRPVINVSWNDVVERYLPWLNERLGLPAGSGYRLLTEAEWEYCCRAGTETAYSFGDTIAKSQAQFSRGTLDSARQTIEVGRFPANAFGLHDMHGNVWEWCQDAWLDTYQGAPADGSARSNADTSVSRVLRGGSWFNTSKDLNSADRVRLQPDLRDWHLGFRLARTLNP